MDVETILNQIRERVVSEESARLPGTSISRTNSSPDGSAPASTQNEALARLGEYLTVTGRAWNQLPPVFSSRRGTAASQIAGPTWRCSGNLELRSRSLQFDVRSVPREDHASTLSDRRCLNLRSFHLILPI